MKKIDELNKALTGVEKEMASIENTIINEVWVSVDMLRSNSIGPRLTELYETASSIREHLHTVLLEYKRLVAHSGV